ncbi:MAG: hypothetical protein AAGK00_12515, partial [Pseudomonadota bacterium]
KIALRSLAVLGVGAGPGRPDAAAAGRCNWAEDGPDMKHTHCHLAGYSAQIVENSRHSNAILACIGQLKPASAIAVQKASHTCRSVAQLL